VLGLVRVRVSRRRETRGHRWTAVDELAGCHAQHASHRSGQLCRIRESAVMGGIRYLHRS